MKGLSFGAEGSGLLNAFLLDSRKRDLGPLQCILNRIIVREHLDFLLTLHRLKRQTQNSLIGLGKARIPMGFRILTHCLDGGRAGIRNGKIGVLLQGHLQPQLSHVLFHFRLARGGHHVLILFIERKGIGVDEYGTIQNNLHTPNTPAEFKKTKDDDRNMAGFKAQLQTRLKNALNVEEKELLPSSFQRLGHVVILRLKPELLKKKELIGEAVLTIVPGIKTVCVNTGKIDSEFRQPKVEYVCGEENTKVIHTEHGCVFAFDVTKLMWSMGNMNERKRMYEMVKKGEVVVDFFAGIGYWSIPIAKHAQPEHVYAIDANPDSIASLRENQKLNKIPKERMTILHGKCEEVAPSLGKVADRIILGYLPAPTFALEPAFHTFKPRGGILHYEGLCEEGKYDGLVDDVRQHATPLGWEIKLLHAQPVKSMAPRKWHYVVDIQVQPIDWDEGSMGKKKTKK